MYTLQKSFAQRGNLQDHFSFYTVDKDLRCSLCSKSLFFCKCSANLQMVFYDAVCQEYILNNIWEFMLLTLNMEKESTVSPNVLIHSYLLA